MAEIYDDDDIVDGEFDIVIDDEIEDEPAPEPEPLVIEPEAEPEPEPEPEPQPRRTSWLPIGLGALNLIFLVFCFGVLMLYVLALFCRGNPSF